MVSLDEFVCTWCASNELHSSALPREQTGPVAKAAGPVLLAGPNGINSPGPGTAITLTASQVAVEACSASASKSGCSSA